MFFPLAQAGTSAYFTPRSMTLIVRADGDPARLAVSLRAIVHSADRNIPVSEVRTLDDVLGTSVSSRRFNTALLAGFAALALLLAGIGTYGVISYGVTQRAFEIGVRMALGAEARQVSWLVLKRGLLQTALGISIGLLGAFFLSKVMSSLLVDITARDPITFTTIALVLTSVAIAACLVPAQRATRVDPLIALRAE